MTVINTNVSATLASNAVSRNERAMSTAMERLSTGKRINSAADDAAGQAIASRMSSQVKGLSRLQEMPTMRFLWYRPSRVLVKESDNILTRMKEIAVQAASGTYSSMTDRALNLEFTELKRNNIEFRTRRPGMDQEVNALLETGLDTHNQVQVGAGKLKPCRHVWDWSWCDYHD